MNQLTRNFYIFGFYIYAPDYDYVILTNHERIGIWFRNYGERVENHKKRTGQEKFSWE